jgi:hypothetical protein
MGKPGDEKSRDSVSLRLIRFRTKVDLFWRFKHFSFSRAKDIYELHMLMNKLLLIIPQKYSFYKCDFVHSSDPDQKQSP